jgi:hypothetical protein
MDILVMIRDFTINFIYGLPGNITDFVLRMGFLLIISALALYIALEKLPWREAFIQLCVAFFSIVISLYLPVNEIRNLGKETLAFTVIISFLCMLFLPEKLPSYLTPMLGNQIRLKGIIKNIMWGLFILQLILGARR